MRNFVSTFFFLITMVSSLATMGCAQDVPITPKPQPANKQETPKPVPKPELPPDQHKFAVIISGVSGEEPYTKQFSDWTDRLHQALVERLGFADENITIFSEKPSGKEQRATAELIRQTFTRL